MAVVKQDQRLSLEETLLETNNNNNYEMTMLDDEITETTKNSRKKRIPSWSQKQQLQVAICNQIFLNKSASEIFGNVSTENLETMLNSILQKHNQLPQSSSYYDESKQQQQQQQEQLTTQLGNNSKRIATSTRLVVTSKNSNRSILV